MLVDNNPYSPAQVFSVLDDGSRVVKLIYPEGLFKLMGKVESAYNHKSACATTDNEQLFDALSALYNKHNFISQDELEKHLTSIECKMNSLKKNGALPKDVEENSFDADGIFVHTLDFFDIFADCICMYYDNSKNAYTKCLYAYKRNCDGIIENVTEYLTKEYAEEYIKSAKLILLTSFDKSPSGYSFLLDFLELKKHISYKPILRTYIATDNTGLYKIGKSENPEKRIEQLACGNPTINLCFTINADIENELHQRFAKKRKHGEWFKLSKEDIESIKSLIEQ